MLGSGLAILTYLGSLGSVGQSNVASAQSEASFYIDNYINCVHNRCCLVANTTSATSLSPSSSSGAEAICQQSKAGNIQAGLCKGLEELEIKDCTSPSAFKESITTWLNGYLTQVMSAIFGISAVQFLGFSITCVFVCTHYTGGDDSKVYVA